jgi:hypothetical protein
VYIPDYALPIFSRWDGAFQAAVQAAYVPSILNQTQLFFTLCKGTAGFLCGVWGVRAPKLHFLIGDSPQRPEDIALGLTYSAKLSNLNPVTVRVIEFPTEGGYIGLTPAVFPGTTEQLLAIMRGDRLFEQFEPWDGLQQTIDFQNTSMTCTIAKKRFCTISGKQIVKRPLFETTSPENS